MVALIKHRVAVALGNQALSSLTNFLFLLFLIRVLSPAEFGLYSIGFAILLGAGALVNGFFMIQMVTLLPSVPVADQPEFAAGVLAWLVLALAGAGFLTAIAVLVFPAFAAYAGALAFTISAFSLKEFFIRYFFSTEKGHLSAVMLHVVLAATLLAVLGLQPQGLSATGALVFYGVAHAAAVLGGLMMARLPIGRLTPAMLRHVGSAIVPGGRWATVSAMIYTIRASAHTFIVAAIIGPVAVAQMNAARVLVTPATIFIPTLSNILLPAFSMLARERGVAAVLPQALAASSRIFLVAAAYSALLLLLWPVVQPVFLGAAYIDAFWIVVLWGIFAMVLALRSGLEWGLQALKQFRPISFINLAGAGATVSAIFVLGYLGGVSGAISGAILGELLTLALLFIAFSRLKHGGG